MFPLHDANPRHGPSYIMWLLVFINIAVFLYTLTLGNERQIMSFYWDYAFVPALFFSAPGENTYRLITSMFMHGGLAHIAGNMFFLYVFGDNIEDRMGHFTFLGFYLAGGVLATLAHALLLPGSSTPLVGASGAVSAVLGAYILLFPRQRVLTFLPPFFVFWLPAWFYLGYWIIIQVMQGVGGLVAGDAAREGVAWWAHIGGFAFGMATVNLLARKKIP